MSRFDDNRREELREMTRTALATALTGAAAGLSAAAKALHSTAQQIRPPTDEEPSQPSRSQTAPTVRTPASAPPGTTEGKGEGTAAARARARAAAAREEVEAKRDRASQPAEPTAPASEAAAPATTPAAASASEEAPRSTDPQIAELADRPVRGLLSELDRLNPDQLRALRAAEVAGKHRKTVIEAIDRKL